MLTSFAPGWNEVLLCPRLNVGAFPQTEARPCTYPPRQVLDAS